jgi:hypothetical protein
MGPKCKGKCGTCGYDNKGNQTNKVGQGHDASPILINVVLLCGISKAEVENFGGFLKSDQETATFMGRTSGVHRVVFARHE